ncbi:hypothetical protein FNO01nite_15900 [Flavobacterium noncentrifugens]|uniref:Carbohydrate binding domain-containing protein n=1 Tax=Flavobacterium noncentrifugens TaxID=1128970 RepID=A0A1G8WIA1_9FLAO|nr:carbohydrate binding domain-containing protein [Flavobacterium noncentrifugens]GEP50918.1 hypothetical protein FNO01nite_15900 [Flavobacterium noncentrifugens]SDJ77270.1 Carbohydrate binding domain-containing protein [Flavobacterium noncentrifugens]
MKNKLAYFLVLLPMFCLAQANLVKNGGFESELNFWRGENGTLSAYVKKSGKNALNISQFSGKQWKGYDQILVLPETSYAVEISAWIKTDAVEGGKETYNAAVVTAEFATSSEKNIRYENLATVLGTTDWTLYKKTVKVPEDAKKLRLMLALAETNGSVFFDDIKVIAVSEENYKLIQSNTK